MFAIIGKDKFSKDDLVDMLVNLGLTEPRSVVSEIEKRGAAMINGMRIMYVR